MTTEDLAHIFYSNYASNADWGLLDEIIWMYEEGLFKMKEFVIESEDEFWRDIERIEQKRYIHVFESGDGIRHQGLKLAGAKLLTDKFQVRKEDVLYEHSFLGFEVDVIDRGGAYPIECGDTNALKLEKYLSSPIVKQMVVIPYPKKSLIVGYVFTANAHFSEYINYKTDYLRQELKKRCF